MINGANLLADAELLGVGREGCHDRGHGFETKDEEPGDLAHSYRIERGNRKRSKSNSIPENAFQGD
jgi:hypothetical protein